jgi:uncharacterized protein YceK
MAIERLLLGMLLLLVSGCATYESISQARPGSPKVYSGLRMDWHAAQGDSVRLLKFRGQPPSRPWWDLPFSAVADTLLLPLTMPAALYETVFE